MKKGEENEGTNGQNPTEANNHHTCPKEETKIDFSIHCHRKSVSSLRNDEEEALALADHFSIKIEAPSKSNGYNCDRSSPKLSYRSKKITVVTCIQITVLLQLLEEEMQRSYVSSYFPNRTSVQFPTVPKNCNP